MLQPLELVIFDCDGVLVDTERLAVGIDVDIAAELGWPLTATEVVDLFMGKSNESVRAILEERLGTERADLWQTRYHQRFEEGLAGLEPVDGIVEALDALELPACVASSGSHEKMRKTLGLTGLYERFDGRIYSATEVTHGKPAPDLFLHAAERMGVDPAACAVVEDSQYGVQGARAAGMRVFGYSGGLSPAAWLEGAGAVVFDDMRKLPALLADS
ncbi:MAG: HAD family hydrolase [Streptomyces sp.]|jgi:HAD superfamily hydrolase (TIGR01509 family)|nr:HAD family hydrolase [Streptomyces sp.]